MNEIRRLKPLLLKKIKALPASNTKNILNDSRFLLYCFRYYKHYDREYTRKITKELLGKIKEVTETKDKMRLVHLCMHLSVTSGSTVEKSVSQELFGDARKEIKQSMELKPLLNTLILLNKSPKSKDVEETWTLLQTKLHEVLKTKEELKPLEILTMMYNLARSKSADSNVWTEVLRLTANGSYKEMNISQVVICLYALANIRIFHIMPAERQSLTKLVVSNLKQICLEQKDSIITNEVVTMLYSLRKLESLDSTFIMEFENIILTKTEFIKPKNFLKVCKIYDYIDIDADRVIFLSELKEIFAKKLNEKDGHKYASQFLKFEKDLLRKGIRTKTSSVDVLKDALVASNIPLFQQAMLEKLRNQSYLEICEQCFLVQAQLLKNIDKIGTDTLLHAIKFFTTHGEISNNFAEQVIQYARKTSESDPKKPAQRLHSLLIIHNVASAKNTLGDKMHENLNKELLECVTKTCDDLSYSDWYDVFSAYQWQKDTNEIESKLLNSICESFSDLKDQNKLAVCQFIAPKVKHQILKDYCEFFLNDNLNSLSIPELCATWPIISASNNISEEVKTNTSRQISTSYLTLTDIRCLLKNIDTVPSALIMELNHRLLKLNRLRLEEVEILLDIIEIVLTNSSKFDQQCRQHLVQLISQKSYALNQSRLDNLVDLFCKYS